MPTPKGLQHAGVVTAATATAAIVADIAYGPRMNLIIDPITTESSPLSSHHIKWLMAKVESLLLSITLQRYPDLSKLYENTDLDFCSLLASGGPSNYSESYFRALFMAKVTPHSMLIENQVLEKKVDKMESETDLFFNSDNY